MEFCKFRANFVALTVVENALLPNSFEVNVTFTVNDPSAYAQNIAFQRIKQFLNNELNCTVIMQKTSSVYKTMQKLQNKIVVLPDDGPDWVLSCALAFKLNAIVEGRFTIEEVEVSSSLGDNISYYAEWERKELLAEILNDLPAADRWWNTPDINFNRFQKFTSWKALGLDWQLTKPEQDVKVEKIIQFKPRIVKGGSGSQPS
jgi:hypothetical protein